MFKDARKQVGLSINLAALDLNIGARTLVNYENGHTDTPPDIVLSMASTYRQPALVAKFCAKECPIGQVYAHSVEEKELTGHVLAILNELNDVKRMRDELVGIAADGTIDEQERPIMERILKELADLDKEIDALMWWARSELLKQKPTPAMVAEERVAYGQKNKALAGA